MDETKKSDPRIDAALDAVWRHEFDTRCTCPADDLQHNGYHYLDCPRGKVRLRIRDVLTSLVKSYVVRDEEFLVFYGSNCYPLGGWDDLLGIYNTKEEAEASAEKKATEEWGKDYQRFSWHQVVDWNTKEEV